MIRVKDDGGLLFYIAKKDQEDEIASVERDSETELHIRLNWLQRRCESDKRENQTIPENHWA